MHKAEFIIVMVVIKMLKDEEENIKGIPVLVTIEVVELSTSFERKICTLALIG